MIFTKNIGFFLHSQLMGDSLGKTNHNFGISASNFTFALKRTAYGKKTFLHFFLLGKCFFFYFLSNESQVLKTYVI
jgi:hypothetical protein